MLLYIHIPFCDSKCHYCSFNSFTQNHHLKKSYFESLLTQLEFEIKRFDLKKNQIESIFVGGGTPSTIKPTYYEKLFEKIAPYIKKDAEITFEANPNSATKEWLKGIKELGANRVSFGVQSFDEKKLKFLGRSHSFKDAIRAINDAKSVGFEKINIDIIYDTKLDTKKLLKDDIKTALTLPISHISAYSLTIEKNTYFENKDVKKDDEYIGYYIKELIPFEQYEVSNFGQHKSIHNMGYWRLKDYIGVGCGAVGFSKNRRFYPYTDLNEYIKNPTAIKEEILSDEDIRVEKIFLGLRSCVGVDIDILDEKKVKILEDEGKIYKKGSKIFNTNYFVADEIALFLI